MASRADQPRTREALQRRGVRALLTVAAWTGLPVRMGVEARSPATGEQMEPGVWGALAPLQAGNLLVGPFRLWAGLGLDLPLAGRCGWATPGSACPAKPGLRLEWTA